jgi:hypothetical protein
MKLSNILIVFKNKGNQDYNEIVNKVHDMGLY